MPEPTPEQIAAWKPLVNRVVFQAFYRSLGQVSLPCSIAIASECVKELSEENRGNWRWLLEDRVLVWHDIPIDNAIKIHCYVWGSKTRQKNTVITRTGFWRMWFIETSLRTFDRTLPGRILSRIGGS